MRRLVAEHGETAAPGDIFAFNDPYGSGGMHLPDVFVVKPVFVDGVVVGYAGTLGHQSDIGGIAPGSMALYATEIYQEGLRIPLMKLYDAGEPNRTLFQLLEKNVRVPVEVLGDIDALVAACASCERGLERLVTRYGRETFARYVEALHDHAERLMREEIAAMPDGVYEFEDWLDGMGDVPEPVRFKVSITISGDTVTIDWAGTSGQLPAAINGPLPTTNSMAYLAVRCAARSPIPNCEGFIRPITVTAPLGSVVNPTEPAACASRGIIAYRMLDAMFGALSEVAPERIPAACEGGPTSTQFSCTHEGRRYVTGGGSLGCWGGRHRQDGLDGVSNPGANMSNQPIELIEASVPMEISRYGLVENSGGAGTLAGRLRARARVQGALRRSHPARALRPPSHPSLRAARGPVRDAVLEHHQSRPRAVHLAGVSDASHSPRARRSVPAHPGGRRRLRQSPGARSGDGARRGGQRDDHAGVRLRRLRRRHRRPDGGP